MSGQRVPGNAFVRGLQRALIEDAGADVRLALQVGTLLATGTYSRAEIAQLTKAPPHELRGAYARLERIAPALAREDDAPR